MSYEQNEQEWTQQFSIEKNIGSLFLIKNHISNLYIIATNFDINTASYHGNIFGTIKSLESALNIFERVANEMSANKKAGVAC